MLERFLLLWLLLLCGLAYGWPALGVGTDPFVQSRPALNPLFALAMLMIGSLLPGDEVRQLRLRWKAVVGGTLVQYTTMPLLGYLSARLSGLPSDLAIGIIVVGCVPGAMASNVLTLAARGNVSYSVSLTTLSTLLSPLVVPLVLWLTLGATRKLDPLEIGVGLILQVVGPVLLGHLLARRWAGWGKATRLIGPPLANLVILWIIAVVVALNRDRLAAAAGTVVAVLLLLNLLGYAAGYAAGRAMRLPAPMGRALTLEVGMQNAGLGTLLAQQLFPDLPATAIPPAAYTFGCMLTGAVLAKIWAGLEPGSPHAPAGEPGPDGPG